MKESEIRPKELFDKYLELSAKDIENFEAKSYVEVPCPGCGKNDFSINFQKIGFQYVVCNSCNSLYCNPRPTNADLSRFYGNSESNKYWSNVFFPTVLDARVEKIFKPKAKDIFELFKSKGITEFQKICDFGCGHGYFLEVLKEHYEEASLYGVEPSEDMAKSCEDRGIKIYKGLAEDVELNEEFDFVLSSEVIEHVFNTESYIKSMFKSLKPGGYSLITGLGYEGFDILTLQNDSKSVSPPHHLNFMSVEGFKALYKRVGFSEVEVITPGKLDVDIVLNSGKTNPFLEALKHRGSEAIEEFQSFLRKYKLSSHVWVVAKK